MRSEKRGFTLRRAALVAVEESAEELHDGALVGGGQLFDALESSQEAGVTGAVLGAGGLEAEELVGGDVQGLGEAGDQGAVEACGAALVIGDQGLVDAELCGQLGLGQAAALADLAQALADGLLVDGCAVGPPAGHRGHLRVPSIERA